MIKDHKERNVLEKLHELEECRDKEHKRIKGLPVAYETAAELERLISFLNGKGYSGHPKGTGPKAVYVCCDDLTYHHPNVTAMACWCSGRNRYPLSADQFIEYYDRIAIADDVDLYHELTKRRYEERLRSSEKKPE